MQGSLCIFFDKSIYFIAIGQDLRLVPHLSHVPRIVRSFHLP